MELAFPVSFGWGNRWASAQQLHLKNWGDVIFIIGRKELNIGPGGRNYAKGYTVTLLFFWLQNVELAKERVRIRVSEGGHDIEQEVIERRYKKGMKNLFNIYLPIVDGALIFDNSEGKHELLAQKMIDGNVTVIIDSKFNALKYYYDNN